jgi:cold shock protein
MEETQMQTGTVKCDGGEDLFAHFSEVQVQGFKSLQEQQKVSYEVRQGPKGKQAANITPL